MTRNIALMALFLATSGCPPPPKHPEGTRVNHCHIAAVPLLGGKATVSDHWDEYSASSTVTATWSHSQVALARSLIASGLKERRSHPLYHRWFVRSGLPDDQDSRAQFDRLWDDALAEWAPRMADAISRIVFSSDQRVWCTSKIRKIGPSFLVESTCVVQVRDERNRWQLGEQAPDIASLLQLALRDVCAHYGIINIGSGRHARPSI